MINKIITISDFSKIGDIAKHYNKGKFQIADSEAEFDMIDVFGEYAYRLIEALKVDEFILSNNEELDTLLLQGGSYSYDGKIYHQRGLKSVVMYYVYSRYILINHYSDTANGSVTKTNDFSMATPLKEVKDISNHYRNLAKESAKGVIEFLCRHDEFEFDSHECKACKVKTSSTADTIRGGSKFKIVRRK